MSGPIVGVDLGTCNTVVAYCDDTGNPRVVTDEAGHKVHPSVVSFHPNGETIVGAAAKQRKIIDPRNTVYAVKRLIGRSMRAPEAQAALGRMSFAIKEGANEQPIITTRAGAFSVPEISALVLDHVRTIAARALGQGIGEAVITVPANFNDAQRAATATAGQIAGLNVVRVLNEPTAAALAYGHARELRQRIAVYDFGGGTFDVTVLKLDGPVYEVLGTAGDSFLGGDDIDERIVDQLVAGFLAEQRIDLRTDEVAMMRLRAVAEQTKIELSRRGKALIKVDEVAYAPGGTPLHLQAELSRDGLVKAVADLVARSFAVCGEALRSAGLRPGDVDDVVLVGGTTKMPYVRDQVAAFFGRPPRTDINSDEAVAIGASLQATALRRGRLRGSTMAPPVKASAPATVTLPGGLVAVPPGPGPRPGANDAATVVGGQPYVDAPAAPSAPPPIGLQPLARITRPGPAVALPGRRTPTVPPMPPVPPRVVIPPATPPATPPTTPSFNPRATLAFGAVSPPRPPPVPPPLPVAVVPLIEHAGDSEFNQPTKLANQAWVDDITQSLRPDDHQAEHHDEATATQVSMSAVAGSPWADSPADWPSHTDVTEEYGGRTARALGLPETGAAMTRPGRAGPDEPTEARGPMSPRSVAYPGMAAAALPHDTELSSGPPVGMPGVAYVLPRADALTILDVAPHALGIATVAGFCEHIIPKNMRIPYAVQKSFTTSRDRQDAVRIRICQGESRRLDQNVALGELVLTGLAPRPRGETTIEVTFQMDASGRLRVVARDAISGREQDAAIDLVAQPAAAEVAEARDRLMKMTLNRRP